MASIAHVMLIKFSCFRLALHIGNSVAVYGHETQDGDLAQWHKWLPGKHKVISPILGNKINKYPNDDISLSKGMRNSREG